MFLINLLFFGAVYGLVFLFGFKFIGAAFQVIKESKKGNRRFVDALKQISKTKNLEKLKIKTSDLSNGNTEISFSSDGHLFVVTLSENRRLMSCVGHHREYEQQVLHFVYDTTKNTYLEKNISSNIVKDEKKDIKTINSFMDYITRINWNDLLVDEDEKDYNLVKGSLYGLSDLSVYKEKILESNESLGELSTIKKELEASLTMPLKEDFLSLINSSIRLSDKIENLDPETKHRFHSIVERDISKTYYAFKSLSSKNIVKYQEKFTKNINIMQSVLDDILNSIENNDTFGVEKILRVVEEKYKN